MSFLLKYCEIMTVKAVMFDFGATLIQDDRFDYFGSLQKAHRVLMDAGVAPSFDAFKPVYLQVREELWGDPEFREHTYTFRLAQTLKRLGYNFSESDKPLQEAVNVFLYALVDSLYMESFIPKLLEELCHKYKLAVVSNLGIPEVVPITLDRLGITKYFDAVIASGSVGYRKPSPVIFRKALDAVGTTAEETVFVGDSLYHDIQGAKMVGMKAVWLKRHVHRKESVVVPDKTIDSLRDLPKALENL